MGELTDKTKGTAKEVGGVITGDRGLEVEGKKDRAKGGLKAGWENFKREIREALHRSQSRRRVQQY